MSVMLICWNVDRPLTEAEVLRVWQSRLLNEEDVWFVSSYLCISLSVNDDLSKSAELNFC